MSFDFMHFHARSEYSFDSGFFNVSDYVKLCYEEGYESASLTERFNLFSALNFYRTCHDFGIKPIIGCEFFISSNFGGYNKILLLCKDYVGYRNLLCILSKMHSLTFFDNIPVLTYNLISAFSDGLSAIALSIDSDIGKYLINNDFKSAINCFKYWDFFFKDGFYLSLTRLGIPGETLFFERVLELYSTIKINLLATNEVSFLRKNDSLSYRSKIAMLEDNNSILFSDHFVDNKYFKSHDEMFSLFSDIKNVLYNTVELSKKCNLYLKFGIDYSPKFLSSGLLSVNEYLFDYTFNKLLIDSYFLCFDHFEVYISRLKVELNIITKVGFSNYFLVTYEFIEWAKSHDIFVGPGRGSGAGSLVSYLLCITNIDPVANDLLFERFLNINRLTSPDFDVDFCIEGRDLVIDYIFDFYGINNVAQIITFGCMTVKSVIRDVGRILGYSYSFVDRIVKLFNSSMTSLKNELFNNNVLRMEYDASFDFQTIINLSLKIEGVIKGIGKHAGGLIISCVDLIGRLPVQYEYEECNFLTQFDKDDSEFVGFTKFDFLGLKTLTLISDTVDTFLSYYSIHDNYLFFFDYFFFNDTRTYDLLGRGDTLGIFQFESYGIKGVLQKVNPDVFSDIISLIALYRPGPLQSGLLSLFSRRKNGEEKIDYIHSRILPILRETYGVLVYQEQVMLIAQFLSNYTLSDADSLRRVMSKKNIKDMEDHINNFVRGAFLNGVDYESAVKAFLLIERFAGYGFNKAHSVGYGLLAYISCWLKSNYNVVFLSSFISSLMENNEDIDFYLDECLYFNIEIIKPDINRSFHCFTIFNENKLVFGFGFIKGLGRSLIAEIIYVRAAFGFYNSFFDFLYRIDINLLTKKVLQSLVYSGLFDNLSTSKFKLVLLSNRFFDMYYNLFIYNFNSFNFYVDKFFNTYVKNFYYMLEYKNAEYFNNRFLLGKFLFNNASYLYINDSISISNLSFKTGFYYNKVFCGVVLDFKMISNYYYIVRIESLYDITSFYIHVLKYKYVKDILKVGKFLVCCVYFNNKFYELFVEDFFYFRCFFSKYLDIYFYDCFINDYFFINLFSVFYKKCIKGPTKIRFFYYTHGFYKIIYFKSLSDIFIHDDLLHEIRLFKEVYDVRIIYDLENISGNNLYFQ